MDVRVLGTGCPKCRKLYAEAERAIEMSGVEATLSKVESIDEIMEYGVMMTPALVIDGEVRSSGKALKAAQIAEMLG